MTALQNRYDFVLFFDVTNGNPNGDPDAGNLPRLDPETNQGLVSDVAIKRKIRNYVEAVHDSDVGHRIYMIERAVLNERHLEAWQQTGVQPAKPNDYSHLPREEAEARKLTDWMCTNFFDIRTFGAVMTTGVNCGQVRGPVQITLPGPRKRYYRWKSRSPAHRSPTKRTAKRNEPWAASTSSPMVFTARTASSMPSLPKRPVSPRPISTRSGPRCAICSISTVPPRAGRCPPAA